MALHKDEFVNAYRAIGCQHCGKLESDGQRMLTCSGCFGRHYCNTECQRAHWPEHKAECKKQQALKQQLQAQGLGEAGEKYNEWVQHRRSLLMLLMTYELGARTRTHVLVLGVDYQAGKRVPFQVTTHQVLSLDQLSDMNPKLTQELRVAMEKPRPGNVDMTVGYVVILCEGLHFARVVPLAVVNDGTQTRSGPRSFPGGAAGLIKLINMDADEALTLLANAK